MKHKATLLILLLLLVAATYSENSTFTFNEYEHNITSVIQDRVIVDSEYGRFILELDDCVQFDTHNWCLTNLTYDRVEYYPNEYEIIIEHERLCEKDECYSYGQACESRNECTNYCVHEVCRPSSTWCGDGVCDENEQCELDCAINETNQTQETTNQTTQEKNNSVESSQQENDTTVNESINEQTQQNQTQEELNQSIQEENQTQPILTASATSDEPNILAAGLTIFGGIAVIVVIFTRKKKKHKEDMDTYSYRK